MTEDKIVSNVGECAFCHQAATHHEVLGIMICEKCSIIVWKAIKNYSYAWSKALQESIQNKENSSS